MSETKQDWGDEGGLAIARAGAFWWEGRAAGRCEKCGMLVRASSVDITKLASMIAQALRDEREACARVAEQWKSGLKPGNEHRLYGHQDAAKWIAFEIRNREDKP